MDRRAREAKGPSAGAASEEERPCVYLLRCSDGSLYTGWTTSIERRLARHRAGKASRYTASRLPVELAAVLPMADRRQARREEARIKRMDRDTKLGLIADHDTLAGATHPTGPAHSS